MISRLRTLSAVILGVSGASLLVLAGCKSLPASKPEALFTIEEQRGQIVFQAKCARCHYPTTTHGLHGPGLQALTKVPAMPSGAPPTDERLVQTILRGHGMMESIPVAPQDMPDLLAYLHTL